MLDDTESTCAALTASKIAQQQAIQDLQRGNEALVGKAAAATTELERCKCRLAAAQELVQQQGAGLGAAATISQLSQDRTQCVVQRLERRIEQLLGEVAAAKAMVHAPTPGGATATSSSNSLLAGNVTPDKVAPGSQPQPATGKEDATGWATMEANIEAARQEADQARKTAVKQAREHESELECLRHTVEMQLTDWKQARAVSQASLGAVKEDAKRTRQELNAVLKTAAVERQIHEQVVEELEKEVQQYMAESVAAAAAADRSAQNARQVGEELSEANAKRALIETQLSDTNKARVLLNTRLHESSGQTTGLRAALANVQRTGTAGQQRLVASKQRCKQLEQQHAAVQQQFTELQRARDSLTQRCSELEQQHSSTSTSMAQVQEAFASANNALGASNERARHTARTLKQALRTCHTTATGTGTGNSEIARVEAKGSGAAPGDGDGDSEQHGNIQGDWSAGTSTSTSTSTSNADMAAALATAFEDARRSNQILQRALNLEKAALQTRLGKALSDLTGASTLNTALEARATSAEAHAARAAKTAAEIRRAHALMKQALKAEQLGVAKLTAQLTAILPLVDGLQRRLDTEIIQNKELERRYWEVVPVPARGPRQTHHHKPQTYVPAQARAPSAVTNGNAHGTTSGGSHTGRSHSMGASNVVGMLESALATAHAAIQRLERTLLSSSPL